MDLDMELSLVRWGWGGQGVQSCSAKPFGPQLFSLSQSPSSLPSCFLGFSHAVAALGSREG